jgi:hypothetical protein
MRVVRSPAAWIPGTDVARFIGSVCTKPSVLVAETRERALTDGSVRIGGFTSYRSHF